MNLKESIRRILREELSPRVRRRIDPDEMEKEFLESFEFAYDLTKRRKVLSTHFLDELIYTTISMMMDGFHWRLNSTLPEDEFWYDDIHKELENHYRDRIIQMYNERQGINESILMEETEVPAFLRRRFSPEDLDWLVNDVKELIDYGESLDTAIYDGIREFVKSRKFADIDEFGPDADYWESYLRYERPLVDYVKKKLRITDNVNESILREELDNLLNKLKPYLIEGKYLYHYTPTYNLGDIKEEGLIPRKNPNSFYKDGIEGIFLTNKSSLYGTNLPQDLMNLMDEYYENGEEEEKPIVRLTIDITQLNPNKITWDDDYIMNLYKWNKARTDEDKIIESIEIWGTITYKGLIPPELIINHDFDYQS